MGWNRKSAETHNANLSLKTTTGYKICLAETCLFPIELEAIRKLIIYRQKMTVMEGERIPSKTSKEVRKRRKNMQDLQCKMRLESKNRVEERCPMDRKELKICLQTCYKSGEWKEETTILRRWLQPRRWNQSTRLSENKHPQKEQQILTQLIMSTHRLRCETRRWKEPKEWNREHANCAGKMRWRLNNTFYSTVGHIATSIRWQYLKSTVRMQYFRNHR